MEVETISSTFIGCLPLPRLLGYLVVEGSYKMFNSCFKMFSALSNSQYGILINLILLFLQYSVFILSLFCCVLNDFSACSSPFLLKSTGLKCCSPSYSIQVFKLGI